jgi:uncharacterized phage protein gp47/JayE
MADFTPKTSEEILNDSINYLYLNTNISDFNVGSVIRGILEAVSLEDANQYYQMYSLLNSFFLQNAAGESLDDRAADYDVARKPSTTSGGLVLFLDTNLQRSFLTSDVLAGATTLYVEDVSVFGAVPFLVQLGESGNVEQVRISATDVAAGALTIDAAADPPFNQTTYSHSSATTGVDEVDNRTSLVCLFNASSADRLISSGTTLRAQPTNVTFDVECITTEVGLHRQGYFASDTVAVRSTAVGVTTNIPPKSLNQIVGGAPYAGASVVNTSSITGGRGAESDAEFRTRIRATISSLPAATKIALITNLLTTTDPVTSSIVTRVSVVEDFEKDLVYAYVDDSSSSGIANSELRLAEDTLAVATVGADVSIVLNSVDGFPSATLSNSSYILLDPLGSPFVTQYGNLNAALKTLDSIPTGAPISIPAYTVGTTVSLCEAVVTSSPSKRKYYQLDNAPLGDDLLRLYLVNGAKLGTSTLLVPLANGACPTGTEDYIVNEALGQIEFLTGKVPITGSAIYAIYESYTNLLKESQKVVDGDLLDPLNYPGVRSAGVKVLVRPAQRTPVDVVLDITVDNDQTDLDTASFFSKQVVVSYINNLGIGQDVILAEIIESVMGVSGVTNVHISQPQADVTINEDRAPYADSVLIV